MLTAAQNNELCQLTESALDSAQRVWEQVGSQLVKAAANESVCFSNRALAVDTHIPGHPIIEPDQPKVDQFIAIVADMRDSTSHLLQAISKDRAKVSQLQRVFYETAALLPNLAKSISFENGRVTEYLGDGVLGLFRVEITDPGKTVYAAHRAASKCLDAVNDVVNPSLERRYSLPPLKIGIGMAYSKAVVTVVGLPDFMQPIAFGECVFRASKLSAGNQEILVDKALKFLWPVSDRPTIRFTPRKVKDIDGFLVQNI